MPELPELLIPDAGDVGRDDFESQEIQHDLEFVRCKDIRSRVAFGDEYIGSSLHLPSGLG